MSSRNYTVTVNVKDGGMLRKLEALQSGSPIGGKGGGGTTASSGGIFNTLQELASNQLVKLTAIGLGVGSLVGLAVKSSGILQGTMKLWEQGMMLIFKPIGDFIGLAFRPLTLMMLLWAVPFYKVAGKWFMEHGVAFGQFLANFVKDPIGTTNERTEIINTEVNLGTLGLLGALGIMWDQFLKDVWTNLSNVGSMLWGFFLGIGESIWKTLSGIGQVFWGYLVSIGGSIWQTLQSIGSVFWGYLQSIGQGIWSALVSIPDVFMGIFTGLATSLTETLAGVPKAIYDAIIGWIQGLIGGGSTGGSIAGGGNASRFTRQTTTVAAIADTLE